MPQLDIYTFPTQIYFISITFFFCLLFCIRFLLVLFFQSELLEKEEIHTLDDIFLLSSISYTNLLTERKDSAIVSPVAFFSSLDYFLVRNIK